MAEQVQWHLAGDYFENCNFTCVWLVNPSLSDAWYPARSRMVTHLSRDDSGTLQFEIHVDSMVPLQWKAEPYYSDIKNIAFSGLTDREGAWRTVVFTAGHRRFLILPNKDIELDDEKNGCGVIIRIGERRWEYLPAKSDDDAKQESEKLNVLKNEFAKLAASMGEESLSRLKEDLALFAAAQGDLSPRISSKNE
jgi:hypothetical protein